MLASLGQGAKSLVVRIMVLTQKSGRVKYPAGRTFEGQWGPRQNIVVDLDDGTEERMYFTPGKEPYCLVKRGDPVTIIYNGNNKTLAVAEQPSRPSSVLASPGFAGVMPLEPGGVCAKTEPGEVAAYIKCSAKLLKSCWDSVGDEFGADLPSEDRRAMANALFISVNRKFNIEQ